MLYSQLPVVACMWMLIFDTYAYSTNFHLKLKLYILQNLHTVECIIIKQAIACNSSVARFMDLSTICGFLDNKIVYG